MLGRGGIESENVLYIIQNINNKYIYIRLYLRMIVYIYKWLPTSCHDDDELRLGNGRAANQICGRSTLLESLASALAVFVRLLYYCIYNNICIPTFTILLPVGLVPRFYREPENTLRNPIFFLIF